MLRLNSADPVKYNCAAPRSFLDFNNQGQLHPRNTFSLLYFKLEKIRKRLTTVNKFMIEQLNS